MSHDRIGPARAVVSGTASDAHMWNLVLLQAALEEAGYWVCNLGGCVPLAELAQRCVEQRPDLIVLGSVNGHGYGDGLRAGRRLRADRRLDGSNLVIGGKLGITGQPDPAQQAMLLQAGFDGIFEGETGFAAFGDFLADRVPTVASC